jgi:transcriptional regulator with XRE-family HTH domain
MINVISGNNYLVHYFLYFYKNKNGLTGKRRENGTLERNFLLEVVHMELKSKIAEEIKKSGYTRDYVISKLKEFDGKGVSKQQISNWCVGESKPTVERLFQLAKILGCKVDDFYLWEE